MTVWSTYGAVEMTRAFLTMGMGPCTWFQGGSPDGARDGSFFLNWSIVKDCSDAQSGEGNGNPLQYSCLENPMDGGAWCPWGRKGSDMTERLHSLTELDTTEAT